MVILNIPFNKIFSQESSTVWDGDLKTQQLQKFFEGNYKIVNGNITIYGSEYTNLNLLSNLVEVKGDLNIGYANYKTDFYEGNDKLENLNGLEKLTTIEGKLSITRNNALKDIRALSNLTTVIAINISYNESLESLKGLEMIITINEGLQIYKNRKIQNLKGLDNVSYVGDYASFNENLSLLNLEGINNLRIIGGRLSVRSNANLKNIKNLKNVEAVGETLFIDDNPVLQSLEGLEGIDSVFKNLYIYENDSIKNLKGLDGIKYVKDGIEIRENSSLINLNGLDLNSADSYIDIFGNASLKDISGSKTLEKLNGNLLIRSNPNLENLSGLNSLKAIDGRLSITNNGKLTSLQELNNLASINGALSIEKNENLKSLDGLNKLSSLKYSLYISENNSLIDLKGLDNLKTINKNVYIQKNDSLLNINGLNSLEAIGHNIEINNNSSLKTVEWPISLQTISNDIKIKDNNKLIEIKGFEGITEIHSLHIEDNRELVSINGFNSLSHITFWLYIDGNSRLVNINGFNTLKKIDKTFILRGCRNLTSINAFNKLSITGHILIDRTNLSDFGCFCSLTKIIDGCLIIADNPNLTNLKGFEKLWYISQYLRLESNPLLTDIKSLSKLKIVNSGVEISENESLNNFTGINPMIFSNKNLELKIYSNCYNPTRNDLTAGNFTLSPYPPIPYPYIKDGGIAFNPIENYYDEDEDFVEDYEGDYEEDEQDNEPQEVTDYWQRGSIFTSNIGSEKFYQIKAIEQKNILRFYFIGVSSSSCGKEIMSRINLYELEPTGKLFIIDSIIQQGRADNYDYKLKNLPFDLFELKNNKLYYFTNINFDRNYEHIEAFYDTLDFYEYIPGSKKRAVPCSKPNTIYEKYLLGFNRKHFCNISPDKKKIAWMTNYFQDINICFNNDPNKSTKEFTSNFFTDNELDPSNGDFNISKYFPKADDEYILIGGTSWSNNSKDLYFDNSGIETACIWKLNLESREIKKIVPEHEALNPFYFEYNGNPFVAYTFFNMIMVATPENE